MQCIDRNFATPMDSSSSATAQAQVRDCGAALGFLISLAAVVSSLSVSDTTFTAQEVANEQFIHPQLSVY